MRDDDRSPGAGLCPVYYFPIISRLWMLLIWELLLMSLSPIPYIHIWGSFYLI